MLTLIPLVLIVSSVNVSAKVFPKLGACFLSRTPGGCRQFVGLLTRSECCQKRGYFVTKPNHGQLLLASMLNTYYLPNCENSCNRDYCVGKRCPKGDRCISRELDSICSSECTCSEQQRLSGPVCVHGGPKYRNMCHFHLQSCWTNTNQRTTPCLKTGCDRKLCGNRNCFLNLRGRSQCVDRDANCDEVEYDPICGVNNVTYSNRCEMLTDGIQQKREIHIAYKGICKSNARCSNVDCPEPNMSCIRHHSNSSPVCVKCPQSMLDCNSEIYRSDELFCLSINRQSHNTCYKDYLSCQNNLFVEIIHSGLCLQYAKLPQL